MTLLYTDPVFLEHDTGDHPERVERLRRVTARLQKTGLASMCKPGTFAPISKDALTRLHSPEVVERARRACARGGGMLDGDTPVCAASFEVACSAAGAGAAAVDAVLAGEAPNALCLVRPPGHHATPTHSMGFCLFNNVALAADHARTAHGLTRLLIVDWDVHHGNGTQDIFYDDPEVAFLSIHRFGHGFYPGTGHANETGTGRGLGFTLNVPLRFGTPRPQYHDGFRRAIERLADHVKPELVLVSAGFDAHRNDPIGSLGLESEDFAILTRCVLDVARSHARGRLVSLLEGGYDLDALAESVQAHLEELLAAE
jgi:acetoin utilization deacetylase AcuC-like enzyme